MEYFDKKIVTLAELRLIWGVDGNTLKKRIQYNLGKKKLFQIRRGLYSFPGLLGKLDTKEDDKMRLSNLQKFINFLDHDHTSITQRDSSKKSSSSDCSRIGGYQEESLKRAVSQNSRHDTPKI